MVGRTQPVKVDADRVGAAASVTLRAAYSPGCSTYGPCPSCSHHPEAAGETIDCLSCRRFGMAW